MFKGLSVRVGGAEGNWVNAEDVGATRWNVVLRPWRDDAKQWGAAVTVPYADVSLIPVEMPGLFGVAGVPEYPEAGHDDA